MGNNSFREKQEYDSGKYSLISNQLELRYRQSAKLGSGVQPSKRSQCRTLAFSQLPIIRLLMLCDDVAV